MYRIKPRAAAIAVVLTFIASLAHSATITVNDDINDFEAQKRSDATGGYIASENNLSARLGFQSNFNGTGPNLPGAIMPVTFYQLPALGVGESVTSATFSIGVIADTASGAVTPTFNGDLYALGFVNPIGKTIADAQNYWYIGSAAQAALPGTAGAATVTGSVSRLTDNFLVPADFVPLGGTEVLHSTDITTYIQNLYANPGATGFTPGSSFLVLRLSPDVDTAPASGTLRYSLASQGTVGNGGTGTNRPKITLQTTGDVPEPASAMLLVMAIAAIAAHRRKL